MILEGETVEKGPPRGRTGLITVGSFYIQKRKRGESTTGYLGGSL